jgi:hypothetical protein
MSGWPFHLPMYPAVSYRVDRLFDLRACQRNRAIVWGAATDGPATEDEAHDAVADCIEDVRCICHAHLGLRVWRIEAGRAEDVTAQFIALFPEPEELEAAE